MATLGSDKLTGIENVDGNDSVVSKRYVESVVPSVGGATKSYLKAEGKSFSTWSIRTLTTSPDSPGERPSYDCDGGFLYSEKDDVLLAAYHYTTNRENYVSASTDAIHWSLRTLPIATSGTKYPVRSLNYANGLYFADASYNLSVSTDTIHWIARTSGTSYNSTTLSGSGSTNIAYGYSETEESYIYYWAPYAESITSTDTIHWTTRTKPGGASSTYYNRDSLYNDGYFLTVGGDSTNYMIIASTDAIVWQFRTFGATSVSSSGLYYIQYLDEISKYCALGYNHYGLSTDAIHWEPYDNLNGAGQLTPLVYDNDFKSKKYYTCKLGSNSTYDDLYITTDAIHWTTQDGVLYNSGTDYSTSFYAIHKKPGGGFVRPGDKTLYYTSELEKKSFASETSLQSPKGTALLTFDRYYSDQIRHLYLPSGVTSIFVEWTRGAQCGYTGVPGSSSGSGYRSSPLYKTIIKVDPSNDNLRFSYEVGDTNYSQGANGATFKYLDSNSWKDVGYLVFQQISSNNPYSSALGLTSDGQEAYVLGYNGRLASSVGSITDWSTRTCAISGAIFAAHAYNGTFFIANTSGHTASSTDTIHWTLRTIPSPTNVYEIKDWNNLWRVFYGSGNYAVSTDAIHWTKRTVGVSSFSIYSGAYDSSTGTTILVGGSSRKIASSTDDIHWTRRTVATSYSGSANYTSALSNNNGLFVVGGTYGDTQKSTDGIVWTYIDWMSDLGFSYEGRDDNQSGAYSYYDASEYFNGKFYFSMYDYPSYYGRYASVVSSTDAVHWEHENFGDNHTTFLYDISYSDALKTTLTAFHTNSINNNALTSWTLYDSTGVLFGTTMDYNNDGLYSYYDYGVESSYNSGELVSGVSGVSDGNDSGTTQYTNNNYTKSIHTGFFTTSGGSGASKVGNGGSVSKKYYGSTQTVSGGSKNLSVFNLTVTNSGSSNYVISGTDETTTHSSASNPTITVKSGNVVIFDVNASGHPFWIKTDESTGTDNRVPTYVVKNNGAETDKVVFNTVGLNAGTYYYNCQYHSSMRGTINVTASTSSFDGSDGTSNAFSGNRFGMGGGGGAAFEQSPNFWTRMAQSEGFPDSNVFGIGSNSTYDRMLYDSHYNFWVYAGYNNTGGGFAISTDVIHWVLRTVGNPNPSYGYFATNGSGEYVLQGQNSLSGSTDTIHWALRTLVTTQTPYGAAYHAGYYIAQHYSHTMASTDTIHWSYRTTGAYSDRFNYWAVGNGYVLASTGEFADAVVSSTDTIHWGRRTTSTRNGYYTYGLGFAGGLFHASDGQGYGSYNISTDSIHWVLRTAPGIRWTGYDSVKYGSYRGENVYFAPVNSSATYAYSTDTIHWITKNRITLSSAGASTSMSRTLNTDGSGNWYYANTNGDSPDGTTSAFRAFYEPGGEEIYATGNGGDGGLGCSGGGGATTAQFGGIGGLGGQGYIQLSWW
jgi:plastocyanin